MTPRQTLIARYVETYPDEVARRCDELPGDGLAPLLAAMDEASAAALLPHMSPARAARGLALLEPSEAAGILAHVRTDLVASLLRQLEPPVADAMIEALPPERAMPVRVLMTYPQASAGGVMDPLVLTAPLSATVSTVRALVTRYPTHLYYYVYVVDAEHRLVGVLDLAELFQGAPTVPVKDIMQTPVSWLSADSSLDAVFTHPAWRHFDALPVVSSDQRFVGAIRHRRMRQLLETHKSDVSGEPGVRTVMALGEIYWLGLCGLLQGIASTASEPVAGREVSR